MDKLQMDQGQQIPADKCPHIKWIDMFQRAESPHPHFPWTEAAASINNSLSIMMIYLGRWPNLWAI